MTINILQKLLLTIETAVKKNLRENFLAFFS